MVVPTNPLGDQATGDSITFQEWNSIFNTLFNALSNLGGSNMTTSDKIGQEFLDLDANPASHASRHGTGGSDALAAGAVALGMLKGYAGDDADRTANVVLGDQVELYTKVMDDGDDLQTPVEAMTFNDGTRPVWANVLDPDTGEDSDGNQVSVMISVMPTSYSDLDNFKCYVDTDGAYAEPRWKFGIDMTNKKVVAQGVNEDNLAAPITLKALVTVVARKRPA